MTKKHFVALAAILKANNASMYLILPIADLLAEVNPNFDFDKFVAACQNSKEGNTA